MASADSQQVTVEGRTLAVTNLDKVLYPATGTTKGEVIAYYAEIGQVLLPHLRMRPITRKRWPDGVGADGQHVNVFFAKNLPKGTPEWVRRFPIEHSEGVNDYPVANDLATLVWLGQLAALELHVPQWRFAENGTPLPPDRLVLDLDPGEGVTLADCAEVAGWVRELLSGAGLESYPVTSGSKGIHLYAHLDGSLSPAQASDLARELAQALQSAHPDRVTAVMRRADRGGKVFLDWSQNNGNKTTITPYSLRGRTHPTVAAPRTWDELADPGLRHLEFTELLTRLAEHGDLLAPLAPSSGPLVEPVETKASAQLVEPVETKREEASILRPAQDRPSSTGRTGDKLAKYRSMRDPGKTPEPVPAEAPAASEGRSFVIQEHHARRLHYDFRLERDGVLVSWAVPKGPPTDPKQNHLAVPTEDHPLDYGSFEGTIPAGEYGGGTVTIWDAGTYDLEKWRDGKEVIVVLHGRPNGGLGGEPAKFALIRTGENWLIHRMVLKPAKPVVSTLRQAPDGPSSATDPEIEPMLATLASPSDLGTEDEWAFEMKWDGVRVIAHLDHGQVRLFSRKGRDETVRYPDLVPDLVALGLEQAVLDGEIVVLDDGGAPSFGLLQPRINLTRVADIAAVAAKAPAQLLLFDLLGLDGHSLLRRSYVERRELLEAIQPPTGSRVQIPPVFEGDLSAALDASLGLRLEGVVAKQRGSVYQPGRRARTWLKIKHRRTQAVVIGGWRPGQGNREGRIGALLMGIPDGDRLAYVGRVGSGFTDAGLAEAERRLAPLARPDAPLADVPAEDARDARWVEPSLVGEVFYGERTSTGRLRHPVWRGWRPDVSPSEVAWE